MGARFIGCDRDQVFFMPPSVRDWVPDGYLVWTVLSPSDGPALYRRREVTIASRTGTSHRRIRRPTTHDRRAAAPLWLRPGLGVEGPVTLAAVRVDQLAASLGRGATGHHSG